MSIFERSVLAGIGLLSITQEKAVKFVDELVKEGEIRKEDAKGLIDKLVRQGEEQRTNLGNLFSEEIEKAMKKANLATKKDINELNKKIEALLKDKEK
ncbi:MAG: hypothetical protein JXA19_06655 [Anaerolineales bacterium]|nr:hypothetical protein [Anaerolineales bacterium]